MTQLDKQVNKNSNKISTPSLNKQNINTNSNITSSLNKFQLSGQKENKRILSVKKFNNIDNNYNNNYNISNNQQYYSVKKNALNNLQHIYSTGNQIKRNLNLFESIKDENKNQISFIKLKIDEIYRKFKDSIFTKSSKWKEEFLFEMRQENVIDIDSDLYPKSLNTKGSNLLEYTKFWILFIEIKFSDLNLNDLISIFNSSLLHDQNDFKLLYEYFTFILSENFDKKEIFSAIPEKHKKYVPGSFNDIQPIHYLFLLENYGIFKEFKLRLEPLFSETKNDTKLNQTALESNIKTIKPFDLNNIIIETKENESPNKKKDYYNKDASKDKFDLLNITNLNNCQSKNV